MYVTEASVDAGPNNRNTAYGAERRCTAAEVEPPTGIHCRRHDSVCCSGARREKFRFIVSMLVREQHVAGTEPRRLVSYERQTVPIHLGLCPLYSCSPPIAVSIHSRTARNDTDNIGFRWANDPPIPALHTTPYEYALCISGSRIVTKLRPIRDV